MLNSKTTIHFSVNKSVTENDMDVFYNQMEAMVKTNGEINVIMEIENFKGFADFKAFASVAKIKTFALKNIRKCAIVSDSDFYEISAGIGNAIIPNIEIETFDKDEFQEAIEWINEPTKNEKHGLALMPYDDYLHVLVYDTVTKADYELLNKEIKKNEKEVALLVELGDYEGFTIQAALEDIKMAFTNDGKIKKIAVVCEDDIKTRIKALDFITPGLDIQYFSELEMHHAINFLK